MDIFTRDQKFFFGESHFQDIGKTYVLCGAYLDLSIMYGDSSTVFVDDDVHTLSPGYATFIYVEREIEFIVSQGQETRAIWCCGEDILIPSKYRAKLKELPIQLPPSDLLLMLLNEGRKLEFSDSINISRLKNSLGVAAVHEYFRIAELKHENNKYPRAVLSAKRFIEAHYTETPELTLIATESAINPRYLISLFKQYIGLTPIRYMWQLCGEKGVQLLSRTNMTVSDISYSCGFKTPHHFSRYIKEHYDYTPTELRKRQCDKGKVEQSVAKISGACPRTE